MSIEKVRTYLQKFGLEKRIREFPVSSATVELAAKALGCEACRIAKTLSFACNGNTLLLVAAGDCKIDNAKYKQTFHAKAKMLSPEEALALTGHAVGGVCPFALNEDLEVYLDESLKRFETIYPAVGTANSAIALSPDELYALSNASGWVSVGKIIE